MHRITAKTSRIIPDNGFILGNGDLSVSVYCDEDVLSFKFGKGDVWDRRLMYSADPEPVDVDEFKRGLEVEGWKCSAYHGGVTATKAEPQDPERMVEICTGSPENYHGFSSPAPKPVGMLDMYFNPDLPHPVHDFELLIEEAVLNVYTSFDGGYSVHTKIRIDPDENLLLLDWKTAGFPAGRAFGGNDQPVRFALYRHSDVPRETYRAAYKRRFSSNPYFNFTTNIRCTPLEPPYIEKIPGTDGHLCIVQHFQSDLTYPLGFECALSAFGCARLDPIDIPSALEKSLLIWPENPREGRLYIGVETTGEDRSRAKPKLNRLLNLTKNDSFADDLDRRLKASSDDFWSTSSLETEDEAFERMWYETLHIHRSTYKEGKQAPGLFLPSTVNDHSYWHGDYHTNYNIQSPFFGAAGSNHPELLKPYIETLVKWFLPIGQYIAQKYYHCRGCFVQLTGYPMVLADDPLGVLPMGRMVYMTGFSLNLFWSYYRHTLDTDYLKNTIYPFMRECTLFYYDFLTLGEDGLYHAFPSNQGEDGFTGHSDEYRDCMQIMHNIHRALFLFLEAAKIARPDDELIAGVKERFEKLAPPRGEQWPHLDAVTQRRFNCSPPEFGRIMKPYQGGGLTLSDENVTLTDTGRIDLKDWYFGASIFSIMLKRIRNFGESDPIFQGGTASERAVTDKDAVYGDADYNFIRNMIRKWRQDNGTYVGMSRSRYGQAGVFTETLGITGVLTEMLVQSFDGAIAPFPCWPLNKRVKFNRLRAEGAFLVSGSCENGRVSDLRVFSEKGGLCAMYIPKDAKITCKGLPVVLTEDVFGRPAFETEAGLEYLIQF